MKNIKFILMSVMIFSSLYSKCIFGSGCGGNKVLIKEKDIKDIKNSIACALINNETKAALAIIRKLDPTLIDESDRMYNSEKERSLTFVMIASSFGNPAVCQALIEKKASVTAKTENKGTALHFAATSGARESCSCCKILLEAKADIMAQTKFGTTPIMSVAGKNKKCEEFLLEELAKAL